MKSSNEKVFNAMVSYKGKELLNLSCFVDMESNQKHMDHNIWDVLMDIRVEIEMNNEIPTDIKEKGYKAIDRFININRSIDGDKTPIDADYYYNDCGLLLRFWFTEVRKND